ncbi:MAG: DNA-processing protein DprA [Bacillota bacterium]
MDDERLYTVALHNLEGVGSKRLHQMLKKFGSAQKAWEASAENLARIEGISASLARKIVDMRGKIDPEELFRMILFAQTKVMLSRDPEYPVNLVNISDPPFILYYRGELVEKDELAIAVVGTRTPTMEGIQLTERLAFDLASQGITIVSGMARGIDSAAHRGALMAGGRTIAVLGCGPDVVYPPENKGLMRDIIKNGAVISEYFPGTSPLPGYFPQRNRIISGLAKGVVVVEAAHDSGALITADHALEQGRDVFAVPGAVASVNSKGPHSLLKQGAFLVENYLDILQQLNLPIQETTVAVEEIEMNSMEKKIWDTLSWQPKHIDLIIRQSELAASEAQALLAIMEIKGLIRQTEGKMFLRLR